MTADERRDEIHYRIWERLGMMIEDRPPTAAEYQFAKSAALQEVNEIEQKESNR